MGLGTIIISLITTIIMIPLNGLLLMLSAKIFGEDDSFATAIKVALILGIVSFVLNTIGSFISGLASIISWITIIVVSIGVAIWLIKTTYMLEWGKALLVWLVWFIFSLVAGFIIAMIVGAIALVVGIGAMAKAGAALT